MLLSFSRIIYTHYNEGGTSQRPYWVQHGWIWFKVGSSPTPSFIFVAHKTQCIMDGLTPKGESNEEPI